MNVKHLGNYWNSMEEDSGITCLKGRHDTIEWDQEGSKAVHYDACEARK